MSAIDSPFNVAGALPLFAACFASDPFAALVLRLCLQDATAIQPDDDRQAGLEPAATADSGGVA